HNARLEEAGANGVDRLELVAGGEQRLAALYGAAGIDDVLHLLEVPDADAAGQAQLAQVAARAGDLELVSFGVVHEVILRLESDDGLHCCAPYISLRHAPRRGRARAQTLLSCRTTPVHRNARRSGDTGRPSSW